MQLSNEKLLEFYHLMVKIRAFEETLSSLFSKGLLGGTSHFCIGQEASAVGVVQGVRDTDWIVSNHRGHGHLLARYLDVDKVMAELLGKLTGYCGGRGGSQHMCAMDKCFLGTNGITGGGIPLATGAALALKVQKKDDIVVAFQSVFGHDESKWTSPLTRDVLKGWRDGDFRVVLACPGFAIDCLETLYDIPHIMVPALEGEGAAPVVEHVDGDIQAACNTRGRFVWAPTLNASDEHAALIKGVLVKAICP